MAQTKIAKAVESTIDYVALAFNAGKARGEFQRVTTEQAERKETIDNIVSALQKAKVKVGRYSAKGSGCAIATGFADGLLSAGLAKGTVSNYVSEFRTVVNAGSGKIDLNSPRTKAKAKGKAGVKVTPADDDKQADAALRALWNCDIAMTLLDTIESAYQDGKGSDPTLASALKWVMASRGIPFNKDGKATTESKAKAK